MKVRKVAVGVTGLVLGMGAMARAGDSSNGNSQAASANSASLASIINSPLLADDTTTAPTSAPAAAATPPTALMGLLDMTPVGTVLGNAHISVGGYIEFGWFYDGSRTNRGAGLIPARTAGDLIGFPGAYPDSIILDQLDLNIARSVDINAGKFDVGFNFDGFYGTDAWYTHSNGLFDHSSRQGFGGSEGQWDIDVANVVFTVPVQGLKFTVGKMDTLFGNEYINPTSNAFYTHSYNFSYGIDYTDSGIMATYAMNSQLTVQGGITLGWNQGPVDNNGDIDMLAEATYVYNSKLTIVDNVSFGPETASGSSVGGSRNYQFVEEILPTVAVSDQLTVTGDILYAYDNAIAQWYGVCLYAGYKVNPMFTVNARAEWYHDGKGHTTGISGLMGSANTPIGARDTNYFEVTAGVAITPMPDNQWLSGLVIRPEVRLDFADRGVFDGSNQFDTPEGSPMELTCAIDAYYKF